MLRRHRRAGQSTAFTLIEMLAVTLIILILAAVTLGTAKYLSHRAATSQTKALIATLELGITAFQLDNGYYPTTSIYRVSQVDFHAEKANSAALYSQLTSPKQYVTFRKNDLGSNSVAGTFIMDAWETPINYYRPISNVVFSTSYTTNSLGVGYVSPANYYVIDQDNFTTGGLVNTASYDLFSYGPDKKTSVGGTLGITIGSNWYGWLRAWTNFAVTSLDDIGNTRQ